MDKRRLLFYPSSPSTQHSHKCLAEVYLEDKHHFTNQERLLHMRRVIFQSFCWPLREKFRDGFLFQRSQKPRQLIFTGTSTLKMESCMCVGWEHTYSIHTLNSKLYKIIMSFINTPLWNSDLNMFIATGFNPKSLIKPSISNPHLLAIWIPSTSFSSCSKTKK